LRREGIVVVGAGPAGCAAAVQCARLGARPLVVDRRGRGGGLVENGFRIENYPGLEPLPGPAFAELLRGHLDRFGLAVERVSVLGVEQDGADLLLRTDGGTIGARAVILAPGTLPLPLGVDGEAALDGSLVFCEVRDLLAAVPRPKRVVVVGGGEAACDYALTLARAGARVTIAVRGDALRARGRLTDLVAAEPGVALATSTTVLAIGDAGGRVRLAVRSRGGSGELEADAALVAVGRRSAAPKLVPPLTAHRGLFIAGDARLGSLGQVGCAVGDGLLAAAEAVRAASSGQA
jgi:thioredoxin reductase (NADPH)